MEANDILESPTTQDLVFTLAGDFTVGPSDMQHVKDVVFSFQGDWKQYPLCGVGIENYLNSSGTQQYLRREIQYQLTTDGYTSIEVKFVGRGVDNFEVNAVRN